ncbi:hypothetical protein [Achromobacter insolitus]|uniref:hypothetical protein n=1 Tax=Achromobacter insolitus TaxID=217204 RepID=UPI00241CBFA0|nr:hypothetical protein [Achromobacter insolitus]
MERTARFGLQVAPASPAGRGPYLTDARLPEIFPVLREALGKPVSTDALVGQCLQVTWDFLPAVERWLGCQAFFTIGWVDLGHSRQWDQFDDAFISTMLTRGHGGGPVKVHAWLTLDSLEILDVTLMTSLAVTLGTEGKGEVLAGDPNDTGQVVLKPMLVGPDFVFKTGMAKLFSRGDDRLVAKMAIDE